MIMLVFASLVRCLRGVMVVYLEAFFGRKRRLRGVRVIVHKVSLDCSFVPHSNIQEAVNGSFPLCGKVQPECKAPEESFQSAAHCRESLRFCMCFVPYARRRQKLV